MQLLWAIFLKWLFDCVFPCIWWAAEIDLCLDIVQIRRITFDLFDTFLTLDFPVDLRRTVS